MYSSNRNKTFINENFLCFKYFFRVSACWDGFGILCRPLLETLPNKPISHKGIKET